MQIYFQNPILKIKRVELKSPDEEIITWLLNLSLKE